MRHTTIGNTALALHPSAAPVLAPAVADDRSTVLLVHDDGFVVRALSAGLEQEGWSVSVTRSGSDALRSIAQQRPSLVLLAVQLEAESGIEACRFLRNASDVPIVLVSAVDSEIDVVLGLETGADGFVLLPCGLRELSARLRAVVRRCTVETVSPPPAPDATVIEHGDIVVDVERHEVVVRGEHVHLPRKQFALLTLMMRNPGKALTREFLMQEIWGDDYYGDMKTLESHIKRLRTVVEDDPANPTRLVTIRGIGYKFADRAVARI